jgi:hypothetical protein
MVNNYYADANNLAAFSLNVPDEPVSRITTIFMYGVVLTPTTPAFNVNSVLVTVPAFNTLPLASILPLKSCNDTIQLAVNPVASYITLPEYDTPTTVLTPNIAISCVSSPVIVFSGIMRLNNLILGLYVVSIIIFPVTAGIVIVAAPAEVKTLVATSIFCVVCIVFVASIFVLIDKLESVCIPLEPLPITISPDVNVDAEVTPFVKVPSPQLIVPSPLPSG